MTFLIINIIILHCLEIHTSRIIQCVHLSCCGTYQCLIPIYCGVVLYHVAITVNVCSFSVDWSLRFLSLRALWIKLLWIFMHRSLCGHTLSILLEKYLEEKWLGYNKFVGIILKNKLLNCLPKWRCNFTFPLAMYQGSSYSTFLSTHGIVSPLNFGHCCHLSFVKYWLRYFSPVFVVVWHWLAISDDHWYLAIILCAYVYLSMFICVVTVQIFCLLFKKLC